MQLTLAVLPFGNTNRLSIGFAFWLATGVCVGAGFGVDTGFGVGGGVGFAFGLVWGVGDGEKLPQLARTLGIGGAGGT